MPLTGKIALITGAAAGIGQGIAAGLAQAGADIIVADLDLAAAAQTAAHIETLGRRALSVQVDVGRQEQVQAMLAQAGELGRLDILVNNAGTETITPLLQIGEAEWDRILTVNLKGAFLCSQAAAATWLADGKGGRIINIGSIAGLTPAKGAPHYAASKGGLHALTRQLALELAPYGVTVNAVAPGVIRNGLSTRHSLADPERARRLEQAIPLGRAGRPRDIAHAVRFLASPEADYITGVVLPVDGGFLLNSAL